MISGADRQIIHAKMNELLDIARNHYQIEIRKPMVNFHGTGACAGKCSYVRGIITFNRILWNENRDEMLNETVGHEVAHHVAKVKYKHEGGGHGERWIEVMNLFNIPPNQFHNMSVRNAVKRRRKTFEWRCPKGHIIHVNGKFNNQMLREVQLERPPKCPHCESLLFRNK